MGRRLFCSVKSWAILFACVPYKGRQAYMSRVVRKPDFCICEIKDADQLRGNREADQRLCFRYIDSTIPQLPKSKISSLNPSSVAVQPGLCGTWSETPKTSFLRTRLIWVNEKLMVMAFFRQTVKTLTSLVGYTG